MILLDSEDPLLVCLENKQDFADALLASLQEGVANILQGTENTQELFPININIDDGSDQNIAERKIPYKYENNKIFLRRDVCYELSGILEKRQADKKQKLAPGSNTDLISSTSENPQSEVEKEAQIIADRGLDVRNNFCNDIGDEFAYVSINALLVQTSLDGEISKVTDWTNSSKFFGLGIWTDLIAAISHEAPKLKIHVKMIEFREQLINSILHFFIEHLNQEEKKMRQLLQDEIKKETALEHQEPVNMEICSEHNENRASMFSFDKLRPEENIPSIQETAEQDIVHASDIEIDSKITIESNFEIELHKNSNEERLETERNICETIPEKKNINPESILEMNIEIESNSSVIPSEIFHVIRKEVQESCQNSEKNIIGDWLVERCDEQEITLVVNPGYGGSRKMSFIQPDVWAILRYQLIFSSTKPSKIVDDAQPDLSSHHLRLFINEKQVPSDLVLPVLTKSIKKGVFNLLYNLLILRPCFGCFNPELVETFEQLGSNGYNQSVNSMNRENKTLDTNFIGSSQNGRTYAGTVRSTECRVLASSRISDTCEACSHLLNVTINRSILNTPGLSESKQIKLDSDTERNFENDDFDKNVCSGSNVADSNIGINSKENDTEVNGSLTKKSKKKKENKSLASSNRSSTDEAVTNGGKNKGENHTDKSKISKASEGESSERPSSSNQVNSILK